MSLLCRLDYRSFHNFFQNLRMERGDTDPAEFNWFIFTLGKVGERWSRAFGLWDSSVTKSSWNSSSFSLGTSARGDVNGSQGLGWSKAGGCCWQSLEGFSYFKRWTTTVSLGLSECAVCTSCTVPLLQRLRKPRRNCGAFLLWHHFCSENWKPVKNKRKIPGNV